MILRNPFFVLSNQTAAALVTACEFYTTVRRWQRLYAVHRRGSVSRNDRSVIHWYDVTYHKVVSTNQIAGSPLRGWAMVSKQLPRAWRVLASSKIRTNMVSYDFDDVKWTGILRVVIHPAINIEFLPFS